MYPNTCRVIDIYHRRLSNSDHKIGFQASAWPGGEKSRTCRYISEPASRYLPRNYVLLPRSLVHYNRPAYPVLFHEQEKHFVAPQVRLLQHSSLEC